MIFEKLCKRCNQTKPAEQFAKRSKTSDGLQSECKQCKADRYQENRESIRARQITTWAEYSEKNKELLREKRAIGRLSTKAKDADYRSKYKILYAPKIAAKTTLHSHVLTGRIVKQHCEICGAHRADAHHDDYSKPLDVRWLCRKHHALWHAKNGEGLNGRAIEAAIKEQK